MQANEKRMAVARAIWFHQGSSVVLRYNEVNREFEALFFDGTEEPPAIHEVGITMAEALHTLGQSLVDNGLTQ